jgi:hypothetical protein
MYVERKYPSRRATPVVAAPRGCDVERERERRSGRPWRIGARAMAGTVMLLAVSSALAGSQPTSRADTIGGTSGPDALDGRAGNDMHGKPDLVVCGPGSDTVLADETDEISPSRRVTMRLSAGAEGSGSTLFVEIDSANGGSGRVQVAIDHPFKGLPPCQAMECSYADLPATATMLIAPEGDIGTIPEFGGDCAGMGAPCRLTMDRDHIARVTFNGSGCDGNVCTVGDTCVAGQCRPGSALKAGQLSDLVSGRIQGAKVACGGDRRKVVRRVLQPLAHAAQLLGQADKAPTLEKFEKKLRQGRRAFGQAQQKLAKVGDKLSSSCVESLNTATASTATELSCLP